MDSKSDNTCHETKIIGVIKDMLRRKNLPQEDFRMWCKESSSILKESKQDSVKKLGEALEEIHQNTTDLLTASALFTRAHSYVTTFAQAVKQQDPQFTLSPFGKLCVGAYVTPWALKSIQNRNEKGFNE